LELFYTIFVIIISRLIYLFRDKPLSSNDLLFKLLIFIVPLFVFTINLSLLIFLALGIAVKVASYYFENRSKFGKLNLIRIIELAALLFLVNILFSNAFEINLNTSIIESIKNLSNYFKLFDFITIKNWESFWIISAGLLFVMNELNIVVRILFSLFDLLSEENDELKAGRIIGILERIIIYVLVLVGQYGAMGLVIAAKAFARFKAMDEKKFAEYILIGTLLSALLSLITAFAVQFMII
jgi:hypothetical protein